MGNLKWMKLEPSALIADTTHLSAQEFGAYWRICCRMWANNAVLPNDDRMLARIAGVSLPAWRRTIKPAICDLFIIGDDLITQKRVRIEWESASRISAVRVINGSKGGKAKALKHSNLPVAKATDLPEQKPSKRLSKNVAHGVAYKESKNLNNTTSESEAAGANRLLDTLERREQRAKQHMEERDAGISGLPPEDEGRETE